MKKSLIVAGILFASMHLYAQKTRMPNELSFNIGTAAPVGNFSKSDYADLKSGYAKPGPHLNLSGVHYFNKNWGAAVLIGYSQYAVKDLSKLADGYKEDSGTDSTTLYANGNNNSFSILAGPSFRIPAGKNFSVAISAMIGYVNTRLAGFQVFYEDGLDNMLIQKRASAGGLGLQLGVEANYKISGMLFIKAGLDYFYSKPRPKISYENFIVNSGRRLTSYDGAIAGINATIGIGLAF